MTHEWGAGHIEAGRTYRQPLYANGEAPFNGLAGYRYFSPSVAPLLKHDIAVPQGNLPRELQTVVFDAEGEFGVPWLSGFSDPLIA